MKRSAFISISPQALQHNLQYAKQLASNSKANAVIKANAYGHGAVATAGILYPYADGFAVSCINEAIELRQVGIDLPITVLQGQQSANGFRIAMEYDFRLTIHDENQLYLLDQFSHAHRFDLNIKIDSGMHRLGLQPDQAETVYKKLKSHQSVNPESLIMMTHFACADDLNNDHTENQISVFNKACENIDAPKTMANSAGILGWDKSHADWIRPGVMLYGSSPFYSPEKEDHASPHLKAAMTLNAPVISVHDLKKGDSIGYGASWQCPTDMKVAVVACGYADGYPRHAKSGTPVWVNGEETKLLGRVSMDMIVIDVNHITERPVKVGDEAELWGANISVDRVAECAETISYELLCNAGNNCQNGNI